MGAAVFDLVLIGMLAVMHPFIGLPRQDKYVTLEIRILVIPAFQSKMVSGKTYEDGRVSGGLYMGNVTMNFPEDIVVLETLPDREEYEYVRMIKDWASSYPCSCAGFLQIEPFARLDVILDSNMSGYAVYEIHERITGKGEYWMYFSIDTGQRKILLNFMCEAIYYDDLIFDSRGRILRKELFNQTVPLNLDRTLLIGFTPPKGKNGLRGPAYWFVVKERA